MIPKQAQCSYNHCGLCGRTPGEHEETNWAPLRWWDCDDGWRITTLCRWCWDEVSDRKPDASDYAYRDHAGDACTGEPDTDEDVLLAF